MDLDPNEPKKRNRAEDYERELNRIRREISKLRLERMNLPGRIEMEHIKKNTILSDNARLMNMEARIQRFHRQVNYMRNMRTKMEEADERIQLLVNRLDNEDLDDETDDKLTAELNKLKEYRKTPEEYFAKIERTNVPNLQDYADIARSIVDGMDYIHLTKSRPAENAKIAGIEATIKTLTRRLHEVSFQIEALEEKVDPLRQAKRAQDEKGNNRYFSESQVCNAVCKLESLKF